MESPAGTMQAPARRRSRRRHLWWVAVIVVVVALAVTALVVTGATDRVSSSSPAGGPPVDAPPTAGDPPALGAGPTLRIAPNGQGDGGGEDWARAAPLAALPDLIRSVAPGTQILLRADVGPYQLSTALEIVAGGTDQAPVIIRGVNVDGAPRAAEIVGDRADPYRPNGNAGPEVFRLLAGADNLVFEDLAFRNVGNGCVRVGGDIRNLTMRRLMATNVRRVLENHASGDRPTATISGLHIADTVANGYSRTFARIDYDSNHILIENVRGDSQGQDRDSFAQGIELGGTVHAVVIRNTAMLNAIDTLGKYWNGDGFSAESGTYDIRFDNTLAAGNTDAGYDIKTRGAVLVNTVAQDNKRNYRFWGEVTVDSCVARNPFSRGGIGSTNQMHATREAVVTVTRCAITDDDPQTLVFNVDGTSRLTVRDSTVQHAPGGRLSEIMPGASLDAPGTQ